ncbi:unnamed protein product [Heterosigma akashiwo]|mmetsp:Transcript_2061/g.3226  ORF Transcript_2061/g.3226 Transcript_2061/m.3226 type:complete len:297 (-) Transcript_2061:452-1342(-)
MAAKTLTSRGNLYAKVVDHNRLFNPIVGYEASLRSTLIESVRDKIFAEYQEDVEEQTAAVSEIRESMRPSAPRPQDDVSGKYRIEVSDAVNSAEEVATISAFKGILPRTKKIRYVIRTTRRADGEYVEAKYRFSELNDFHDELVKRGLIDRIVPFCDKKVMKGMDIKADRNDEKGEFVQERRRELDDYFKHIFAQYPHLYQDTYVAAFLTIDMMHGRGVLEAKEAEKAAAAAAAAPGGGAPGLPGAGGGGPSPQAAPQQLALFPATEETQWTANPQKNLNTILNQPLAPPSKVVEV